jgi:hypothetical protein
MRQNGPNQLREDAHEGQARGPIYVSAKRTHFIFEEFLMYHMYLEKLMPFAAAFANGFVLGKRTHLEGVLVGSEGAEAPFSRSFNQNEPTLGRCPREGGEGVDGFICVNP